MPRRDLTIERTAQILDAFEQCVVRRGLEGTCLEDVAAEAHCKRSLIRHYVGNRDDLVRAMTDRYVARYEVQLEQLDSTARGEHANDVLLAGLFAPPTASSGKDVLLAEALIAASTGFPHVAEQMRALIESTVTTVRRILARRHPERSQSELWDVAYGLVGLSFNHESLSQLALPPRYRRGALASARCLLQSL